MKRLLLALLMVSATDLGAAEDPLPDGLYARIGTPRGVIVAELFFERTPLTVASFTGLAEGTLGEEPGLPYFDGLTFHRVVPDFVVQGGDPLGTGQGGPGYQFPDEFVPGLRHDGIGVLSMANSGPDTNGSQFFITLSEINRLNYLHTVFGRVIRGLEVLPLIEQGDVMHVRIIRQGARARAFRTDADSFAQLVAQTPRAVPPAFDDPDGLLSAEPTRARSYNQKLSNLARFTGVKIYARVQTRLHPAKGGDTPAAAVRELAEKFGVAKDGAVALYIAESDEWALWIGESLHARFNPSGGDLDAAIADFLTAARSRVDPAPTSRGGFFAAMQQMRLQVDEVIDDLIRALEP